MCASHDLSSSDAARLSSQRRCGQHVYAPESGRGVWGASWRLGGPAGSGYHRAGCAAPGLGFRVRSSAWHRSGLRVRCSQVWVWGFDRAPGTRAGRAAKGQPARPEPSGSAPPPHGPRPRQPAGKAATQEGAGQRGERAERLRRRRAKRFRAEVSTGGDRNEQPDEVEAGHEAQRAVLR
jgi:hypothetical protein